MALKQKLEKLKFLNDTYKDEDWMVYRNTWKNDVSVLQHTIMDNWLEDYAQNGLMIFNLIPTKRVEPYIGEYLTSILEITLAENKFIVLEPISAVTTEYDGKLELYMLGNIENKVSILRQIVNNKKPKWIVAKSYNQENHYEFDKAQLEKLIEEWLQ